MKILFINTYIGGGGAGRNMAYVVNEISKEKENEVFLLLLYDFNNEYYNVLNSNVKVRIIGRNNRIWKNSIHIIRYIISIRPDVCYTGNYGLNLFLSFFIPLLRIWKIRFISRETHVLSSIYPQKSIKILYKLFYNGYNKIIAQSEDMKNDLILNWGVKSNKVILINNPIDIARIKIESEKECVYVKNNARIFVSVGRLVEQKGYDILLLRMSELKKEELFHLYLIGNGALDNELKFLAQKYGIDKYVHFLGFVNNPFPYIKAADGFILSSRHEGFPNVLLEANALGVPVLTNRCPGGINEIVVEGINGISCDFEKSIDFVNAYHTFLNTTFNKDTIIGLTKERYDINKIMFAYRKVFESVMS